VNNWEVDVRESRRIAFRAVFALAFVACSSPPPEDCGPIATVARAQVQARVDSHTIGCTTDSDCVMQRAGLTCYSGCPAAIVKGEESALASDLDTLSNSICGDTSCTVNVGCVPVVPSCSAGVCHTVEGEPPDAGPSPDGGSGDAGSGDGG
jgi:hypothetical protein